MKSIIFTIILVFLAIIGQAQSKITFDKVVHMTVACTKAMDLNLPPNNTDFIILEPEYIDRIIKQLEYRDRLYDTSFTKTLIIYESNRIDSMLIVENTFDSFRYIRENNQWLIQSFEVTSSNYILNHLAIGLNSKDVFKILNKKNNSRPGKGQIWIVNDKNIHLILTFSHDKLISMKL